MKSTQNKIFIFVLVLIVGAFVISYMQKQETKIIKEGSSLQSVTIGDKKLFVETAKTPEERALGLMHRTELADDHGMLFVFAESPRELQFWNKNTLIPLDVIWIKDNHVIGTSSLPAIDDQPIIIKSPDIADHVIEVNAGWTTTNNIKINDSVTF